MSDFKKNYLSKQETDNPEMHMTQAGCPMTKDWKSPEQYDALSRQISALTIENEKLKAATPLEIVPKFVDEWLKSKPLYRLLEDILIKDIAPPAIDNWFDTVSFKSIGVKTLDESIARLKLDGYKVETDKIYVLKHIDKSALDANND